MANTISILLKAKDEASAIINKMGEEFSSTLKRSTLAVGGVGLALSAYEKSSVDMAKNLVGSSKAIARQTGETVEQSSRLLYVFGRVGVEADQMQVAFRTLSQRIDDARNSSSANALKQEELRNKIEAARIQITQINEEMARNGDESGALQNKLASLTTTVKGYEESLKDAGNPLAELNVQTQNADGSNRSFHDILLQIADRFKEMPSGVEKTATAVDLFGRQGDSMVKVLDQGKDGIIELEKQADKLGLTLTDKTIGAIAEYSQAQRDLKETTEGLMLKVGTLTAPVMTEYNKKLNEMIELFVESDTPMKDAVVNILAFGGPIASGAAAVMGFVASLTEAKPALGGMFKIFRNPLIIAFGLALGAAGVGLGQLEKKLGSWNAVMDYADKKVGEAADKVREFLEPSFNRLGDTLESRVLPMLQRLWTEVIEPLIPVIGILLVGAIWLLINGLTLLLEVGTPLIQFLIDNKEAVLGLAAGVGTLWLTMKAKEGIDEFVAGFTRGRGAADKMIAKLIGEKGLQSVLTGFTGWGIFAAAAIALIVSVQLAVQALADEVNKTLDAIDKANKASDKNMKEAKEQRDAGKISQEEYTRRIRVQAKLDNQRVKDATTGFFGLPGFASGTDYAPGGMALVGEQGPELVNLPRGSQVKTAGATRQALGAGVTIQNLNVYNNIDAQAVAEDIAWRLATA